MKRKTSSYDSWLSALIVAITVTAILAGVTILHYVETKLVESAGNSLMLAAVDIADKLDMEMAERYADIQMLSQALVFQGSDHLAKKQRLLALLEIYPVYRWAGVTDEKGRILVATDEASQGLDMSEAPGFLAVRANQRAVIQNAVRNDEGVSVLMVVSPINDVRGRFIGAVISQVGLPVLEDSFARSINALQVQWGTGARIEYLFLDQDGNVFVDSILREEGQINLKQQQVPSATLFDSAQPGFVEEQHVRRQVAVVTGYARTKELEGAFSQKWGVLVRVDRSDILVPIRAVVWKVGLWSSAIFLPMLAVILWMVMRLRQERQREQCMQANLQSSQVFLQSTLDALTFHIAILDEQGTIVAVNGMWRQFAVDNQSSDPHHMVGKNYLKVCDTAEGAFSEEAKEVANGIRALREGARCQYEFEYPCHSRDKQRWFGVRISRFDFDGTFRLVVAHHDVTESKLAVLAIRQISETARLVISNALDAHIMIDQEGIIVGWSQQAEKMFGWSEGEAMGRRVSETIVPPHGLEAYEWNLRHFPKSGTGLARNKRIESVGWHRDGWEFPVEVSKALVKNQKGEIISAFVRDITERKQEERRQATQYSITRLLLDSKNLEEAAAYIMETICQTLSWNVGALWKVDEETQVLRCQEVWHEKADCAQFIECTRQNSFAIGVGLPGRVWKTNKVEWIVDVGCDSNFPRLAAATSAGLRAAFAFPIGSRDRLYGVMEFFATALREPDKKLLDMFEGLAGQISQFLGRKLTEQRLIDAKNQAEQAARERGEILAAVEAFFICVNGEGVVTTWTPRAEILFGISLGEALGRPFTELRIQWNWKEVAVAMEKASDTINSILIEKIRLAHQNGREVFLKLTVSPICDDRGVTYVFMGEDISDRLALEHDLVQAQKLESIGHLAAGIAHEINTPTQFVGDNIRFLSDSFSDLAAVLARHRALLLSTKAGTCTPDLIQACEAEARRVDLDYLTEELPKAIAQSSEGITRIATIVRAMKEFAHPGSDEKACVDLNKAIESTVTVARNEWKYIADLTTDLASDLPLVPCLLGQFNQVILNMIVNATHAIADVVKGTGAKGTISITTRLVDGWAEVRITDSGTGIPEEVRGKIFDPFFTTKEVGKGTGQGLAIAHSVIVDKHHGTIAIESAVGQGATFIVRLPLDLHATTAVAGMAA